MPTLDRSGVHLFYRESGTGDPPMVFVHGWTCDHSYFSPQLDHFELSHRVVGIDLRGHGASDAPEGDYSMPALADDVAWVCSELGVTGAVVVGHSMGAVIATELAASHPELAGALVLVDPATIGPPSDMVSVFADSLAGPDGAQVRRSFVEARLFSSTDDPELKERVVSAMLRADNRVAAACMRGLGAWDGSAALGAVRVPALVIHADRPMNEPEALTARCPTLVNAHTPGVGHFNQLLAPDAVNSLIDDFVRGLGPSAA
jgi:pimeloyl-ACP methyl ester carboxylesterase